MSAIVKQDIRQDGLVAEFYIPQGGGALPGLLVLGGSEGGISYARQLGRRLAAHGYGTLCLAYFKAEGLPRILEEIPLEYFQRAIQWLGDHPRIDSSRIGVFGPSKGAEAALLIASHFESLACVVAAAPSSVVWQSQNYFARQRAARSSWTRDGAGLPFLAVTPLRGRSVAEMCGACLDRTDDVERAQIPVERIKAPVLLFSGGVDRLWPSRRMAEDVVARMAEPQQYQHICYPDAGHLVFPLFSKRSLILGALFGWYFGGTGKADGAARKDCLRETLAFFERHLLGAD
ncbi:MAG: hydrolase of the alpha/beta superfamily [Alphaproteobacteria bacterium]|nr:hydrolase of the alpha/beta superfamily [Alphaproteobacteria bacterium]